jgi:hypothetical protein
MFGTKSALILFRLEPLFGILGGKLWEWTSYVIPNTNIKPYESVFGSSDQTYHEYTSINSGFDLMRLSDLLPRNAQKSSWNDLGTQVSE